MTGSAAGSVLTAEGRADFFLAALAEKAGVKSKTARRKEIIFFIGSPLENQVLKRVHVQSQAVYRSAAFGEFGLSLVSVQGVVSDASLASIAVNENTVFPVIGDGVAFYLRSLSGLTDLDARPAVLGKVVLLNSSCALLIDEDAVLGVLANGVSLDHWGCAILDTNSRFPAANNRIVGHGSPRAIGKPCAVDRVAVKGVADDSRIPGPDEDSHSMRSKKGVPLNDRVAAINSDACAPVGGGGGSGSRHSAVFHGW